MYVLYRLFRVRMAAGMMKSSISDLHQMISNSYEQAEKLLRGACDNENEGRLQKVLKIRNHIAGLWCIYAQLIVELGQEALNANNNTEKETSIQPKPDKTNIKASSIKSANNECKRGYGRQRRKCTTFQQIEAEQVTSKDVQDHAISVLIAARSCPLVKNHSWIVLAMARLLIASCALGQSKRQQTEVRISKELMCSSISQAIASCWDSMHDCHRKSDTKQRFQSDACPKKSIELISHFHSDYRPIHKERRVSEEEIESSMQRVLALPTRLEETLDFDDTFFVDRDGARVLCVELNRLSRLGEHIEKHECTHLRASDDGGTLLDHLPMFESYDVGTEERPGAVFTDVEYVRQTDCQDGSVYWHW